MPKPVEGTSPYNAGLDGLRAVAVLGVVAYHLGLGFAQGGLLGVAVFFVLSGYLITDLLVVQLRRQGARSFGQFWVRRARRLLPALFVMLAVVVAWSTLFDQVQLPGLRSDVLPASLYFSNWWYIFHHVSYFAQFRPSPLGHLWSLAIEEQFYLVWPFLVLAAVRFVRNRRVIVGAILALAAASVIEMAVLYVPFSDPTRVYDGTDTRAFELLIGAALAFVWPRARRFAQVSPGGRRVLEGAGLAALAGTLAMYGLVGQYDPFAYRGGMALLSVLTAVVIAVCVHPGARLARWLGVAPLRWVGERSYGIYLWSLPVTVLTTPEGAHPGALRDVLQVAAIFGLAALSWRFVEQPVRHGAIGRLLSSARQVVRTSGWRGLAPSRTGWAVASVVLAGAVTCSLGLGGVVSGTSGATTSVRNILPPAHHVPGSSTGSGGGGSGPIGWRPGTGPRGRGPSTWGLLPGGTPTTSTTVPPAGEGVTIIGDSIMIDAAPYLEQMLPGSVIDAQIGQQLYEVQQQVPELKRRGDIGNRLILELGTNGYYSPAQLEGLLRALGPMRRVVLVNTREARPWEQGVNQTIAIVAKAWPNTTVVNWYGISAHYPQYFEPDQVHLNPEGAKFYASLLVHALES